MVRPKGSDRNKTIASFFADTVTIEIPRNAICSDPNAYAPVDCKGPHSIYEALMACLPSIVRESRDFSSKNRKGLSEIELNKVLVSRGYDSRRRRVTCDSKLTWHSEWYGRRWVNFMNADDHRHIQRGLQALQQFPEARLLTSDTIFKVITSIVSVCTESSGSPEYMWHEQPTLQADLSGASYAVLEYMGDASTCWRAKQTDAVLDFSTVPIPTAGMPNADFPRDSTDTGDASMAQGVPEFGIADPYAFETYVPHGNLAHPGYDMLSAVGAEPPRFALMDIPGPADATASSCVSALLTSSRSRPENCNDANQEIPRPTRRSPPASQPSSRRTSPTLRPAGDYDKEPALAGSPPTGSIEESCAPPDPRQVHQSAVKAASARLSQDKCPHAEARDPRSALLRRLARLGWDCSDLRRLCSFGYSPGQIWKLLASLPPSLQTAIRDAVADPAAAANNAYCGGGAGGEAELVFSAAEERVRQAMEEDGETGFLEVTYDPETQLRTHVFLNERYAALRGEARPALLGRLAAHAADLPSPPPDFLAAMLYGLLHRRAADVTQYVRADCGGRATLLEEHSRKTFDARGRIVKVRLGPPPLLTASRASLFCVPLRAHTHSRSALLC